MRIFYISLKNISSFLETALPSLPLTLAKIPDPFLPSKISGEAASEGLSYGKHLYTSWQQAPMKHLLLVVAVAGGLFFLIYFRFRKVKKTTNSKVIPFSPKKSLTDTPQRVVAVELCKPVPPPIRSKMSVDTTTTGKVVFRNIPKGVCSLRFLHLFYAKKATNCIIYVTTDAPRKDGNKEVLLYSLTLPSLPHRLPYLSFNEEGYLELLYVTNSTDLVD